MIAWKLRESSKMPDDTYPHRYVASMASALPPEVADLLPRDRRVACKWHDESWIVQDERALSALFHLSKVYYLYYPAGPAYEAADARVKVDFEKLAAYCLYLKDQLLMGIWKHACKNPPDITAHTADDDEAAEDSLHRFYSLVDSVSSIDLCRNKNETPL